MAAPASELESNLRSNANSSIQWVFFHLVKELRSTGISETPTKMLEHIQSALIQAGIGAITEVASYLKDEPWQPEWELNSRVWLLLSVLGENNIARAKAELEKAISPENENGPLMLCGLYAARDLNEQLHIGCSHEQWLDQYEGMFASMARLYNVI